MIKCDNCNSVIHGDNIDYVENHLLCPVCYDKYLNYEIQLDAGPYWLDRYEDGFYDEDRPY